MATSDPDASDFTAPRKREFASTHWSVVLAAGDGGPDAEAALAELCQTYWQPLYAFVRRRGVNPDEAQDLTQAFFSHLLEKNTLGKADRNRGRFRAFLLAALRNFLANHWEKARAIKRGGGRTVLSMDFESSESKYPLEPSHQLTPEKLFERRWVLTLLDQVLERLQAELSAAGRLAHFEQLKQFLTGGASAEDYQRAAAALDISPAAAKQAAYRLRTRYRQLFREEVARTVGDEQQVDDEIGRLLESLALG